jgi:L,D-transpeptidase catalytic domain
MRRLVGLVIVLAALFAPVQPAGAAPSDLPPGSPGAAAERQGNAYQATPTDPAPTTTTQPPPPDPCASIPAGSGSGRRVVYRRTSQPMTVWIVDTDDSLIRCYPVSGHRAMVQPRTGTYSVFSRSSYTCNIEHTYVCMRWMVRFTVGPDGDNIGFHEIPRDNGVPVQGNAQLGRPLSSGCVRQSTEDAQFMWNWASIGTKVVVI